MVGLVLLFWGCYGHNFLRFLRIFGEKIAVFLKTGSNLSKKANIFDKFFGENIFKIISSVPGLLNEAECSKSSCQGSQVPAVDNCYAPDQYSRVYLYRSWNTSCQPLLTDLDTSFTYPWDYHGSWHYGSVATLRCIPGYVLPQTVANASFTFIFSLY
jgi:hypothetical protein